MSRYGLQTTIPYSNLLDFMTTVAPPTRDVEFFSSIPWTCKYFGRDRNYRPTPFYSRYAKSDSNDVFFSRTIASDETIPHCLLLRQKDGWGTPQRDLAADGKQRPFSAPARPDVILLIDLKDGINGFENTAHGGAMCALLDETLGMCVELHRRTMDEGEFTTLYTASLNVSFLAPISTPSVLAVKAWLLNRSGRKWSLRAQVVRDDGKVLMETESLWITVKPEPKL